MKKCPTCGRMYSDFVNTCSVCNTSLSGNQNSGSNGYSGNSSSQSSQFSNQGPTRQYSGTNHYSQNANSQNGKSQANKPKRGWLSYLAGLAAFAAAFLLFSSDNAAFYLGAALAGLAVGCIPYFVGRSRGNQKLGAIGLAVTAIVGFLFGIIGAAISAVVFVILIFII